jgi:L-lactate dehydrogenase (cytochrome)
LSTAQCGISRNLPQYIPVAPKARSRPTYRYDRSRLTWEICVAIYKYAGRDASAAYNSVHAPSLLAENLDPSKRKGSLDAASMPSDSKILQAPDTPKSTSTPAVDGSRPPLSGLKNSYDFEEVASRMLSKKAWAFYSSAATDLITKDGNKTMFDRIWIRPRILRDVKTIDTKTTMLGCSVDLPLFISPAAMAKMAHPEGELATAKACSKYGIAQCVCSQDSRRNNLFFGY